MISAIILAAGESKRMGQPKQLLPFGGSTVLGQIVETLLPSQAAEIIVVLGYQAEKVIPQIAREPVKIVVNPDFRQGMSSSIKCGLSHISEAADGVMIVLGDQPLIEKETIDLLIENHCQSKRGIILPVHKGIRGHPVIFKIVKYKDELMRLTGDIGGKQIIERHPSDVLEVEVDSESVVRSIDVESDYRSLAGNVKLT
jgi:molybdenum cofactor cytidylyltransferase